MAGDDDGRLIARSAWKQSPGLFRFVAGDVIRIVEETRMDLVDHAKGGRRFRGDRAREFDRVPVADQPSEIDDMIGGRDHSDRRGARIDSRRSQSAGNLL